MEALKRAWRGEERLGAVFLQFFLLPHLIFFVFWRILGVFALEGSAGVTFLAVLAGMAMIFYSVFSLFLLWRCAGNVPEKLREYSDPIRIAVLMLAMPLLMYFFISTYFLLDSRLDYVARRELSGEVGKIERERYAAERAKKAKIQKHEQSTQDEEWDDSIKSYREGIESRRKKWGN